MARSKAEGESNFAQWTSLVLKWRQDNKITVVELQRAVRGKLLGEKDMMGRKQ